MAESVNGVSYALDFQKRISIELSILNKKLNSQLRNEINRSLYSGNDITEEEREIILKLGNTKNLSKQQSSYCNQQVSTPESDVYLTPQASPSEVRFTTTVNNNNNNSSHTRCVSDSLIDELHTPQENLCKNNALYYSLVPVDEVFDSDCSSGVLEKELAEQDELFKSFKSIISKERKTISSSSGRKKNKPLSLKLSSSHVPTVGSNHTNQPSNINNSVKNIYSKRKQQDNLNSNNFVDDFSFKHNYSSRNNKVSNLQESNTFPQLAIKKADHKNTNDELEYNNILKNHEAENNRMSNSCIANITSSNHNHPFINKNTKITESDDVMSNPEISDVIGQDSVLDAGSSGYMTGSSPRDHTGSETFGIDNTEAATSEDIPHDNERSVASSSVSSDAGTWDSTFPATMEEELPLNIIDSINSSSNNNSNNKSNSSKVNESCNLLKDNRINGKLEQSQTLVTDIRCSQITSIVKSNSPNLPDLVQVDHVGISTNKNCSGRESSPVVNSKDITFSSSSNEGNPHHICKINVSELSCHKSIDIENNIKRNRGIQNDNDVSHKNDDCTILNSDFYNHNSGIISNDIRSESLTCSTKNNFFIDASSLLDESEIIPPPKLISNCSNGNLYDNTLNISQLDEQPKFVNNGNKCLNDVEYDKPSEVVIDNDKSEVSVTESSSGNNDNKFNFGDMSRSGNDNTMQKSNSESMSFEQRRSSLIRRNTFELEPNEEKLAMLRHEYERRQGNQLFQTSISTTENDDLQCNKNLETANSNQTITTEDHEVNKSSPEKSSHPVPPDSLFLIPKKQSKNNEESNDLHSPDSLNNDHSNDNIFDDKLLNNTHNSRHFKSNNIDNSTNAGIHIQDIEDDILKLNLNMNETKEQIFNSYCHNNSNSRNSFCSEDISRNALPNYNRSISHNSSQNKNNDLSNNQNNPYVGSTDRLNKIESTPIVSGGASISDFSPPVSSASPLMSRRKAEYAPILSGGVINIPEPEQSKPKLKTNSSFSTSWIVDMSDAVKSPEMKKRVDSTRSSFSSDHSNNESKEDSITKQSEQKSSNNATVKTNPSLGFFIPLDDPKTNNSVKLRSQTSLQSDSGNESKNNSLNNLNSNSSCGFYVDLNKNSNDQLELLKEKSIEKNSILPDKKLFSMFIDISESSSAKSTENVSPKSKTSSPNLFSNKKIKPKSHTNRFFSKHGGDEIRSSYDSQLSSESSIDLSTEHPEVSKGKHLFSSNGNSLNTPPPSRQISTNDNSTNDLTENRKKGGFFMFIEAESSSPVPRRRTLPTGLRPSTQRHSWNLESKSIQNSSEDDINFNKKEHKRAHSVSVDKSLLFNICASSDENKSSSTTTLSKNSSKEFSSGIFESGPASMDETAMRYQEKNCTTMISSWHGPVKPSFELHKVYTRGDKKEIKESKTIIGISSKANLDNNKTIINSHNFNDNCISCRSDETFDISNVSDLSSHKDEPNDATFVVNDISNIANATSNELDISTPSHDIVSELSKDSEGTADFSQNNDSYNRDLLDNKKDNILCIIESPRTPDHSISQPLKSENKDEMKSSFVKLSDLDKEPAKIVVEEQRKATNRMSRSIPEASWIESKMMTRSATSRSLSRLFPHLNTRTPENDDQATEIGSDLSSMQSSVEPSVLGSTEGTEASASLSGPCSRLGEDLLRMFLDEISPDVTVEVGGRRIKAHKCILSSRCQYFAAMLSGGWVESAGNVISLQGFSYNAVHFALCHIYSGASNIPDSINIVELATLADMLCLEGLKEVIMYTLKVKYCHFFHKPCPMCTVGVLECLPLAAAYGLDEIYRKSLRWITRYFVKVWPTKGFTQLPRELIEKCFKQHVVHMSVENVLETVICCEKLQATIPQVRWADPVFTLTQKLLETSIKYITQHFSGVLSSETFLSLGKDSTWNLDRLEDTMVGSADRLSPDQACRSHSRLHTILTIAESTDPPPEMTWNPEFVIMLKRIAQGVETNLIKQAGRAARTPAWAQMEPHLRHRIQDAACLIIIPGDDRRRARHSSLLRRSEGGCNSSGLRSSDLHQVKVAMSQQNIGKRSTNTTVTTVTTNANRSSLPNQVTVSKTAANKSEEKSAKTKSWPYKLAEVKSRYLEQRTPAKTAAAVNNIKERTCSSVPAQRKNPPGKPIISSSDSSRTSSPAMRRSVVPRTTGRTLLKDISNKKDSDGLTMSTDSLVESIQAKPSISGNKAKAKKFTNNSGEINGNVRTPILGDKSKRNLTNKVDGIKTKSAESLSKVNGEIKPLKSNSVSGSQNILSKDSNSNSSKSKTSPVQLSKKSSSQGSPRVKESPVISRAKPFVNSTPSPALRRNNMISANSQQTNRNNQSQENKSNTTIKRTSTYRIQNRATLSPTKTSTYRVTRDSANATASNSKGSAGVNNNNNNTNNITTRVQKSANSNHNNNTSSPVINRVKQNQQLTVGSRSGTFLKDEPTVTRKINTNNIVD